MFKETIDNFFEEVNKRYTEIQKNDPLLFGKAAYIFQTGIPTFQPNLMVIGFNPGGNYTGDKIRLTNGDSNLYLFGNGWFATLRSIICFSQAIS